MALRFKVKPGVTLAGVRAEIVLGLVLAWPEYERRVGDAAQITSGLEAAKGRVPYSKHLTGAAVDLGVHGLAQPEIKDLANELQRILGDEFQVISYADHLHVEFDPRERR